MHHRDRGPRAELDREVAVADGIEAVHAQAVEAERLGDARAVERIAGAGESRSAERQLVDTLAHVRETLAIAREHLDIRQQVMRKAHRLRDLQVREAGQDGFGVALCHGQQRSLHLRQQGRQRIDLAAQPQPHVGGHLVVARAAGVQALAGITDERRQPRLDVQVHVFEFELPLETAGVDIGFDLRQATLDVGRILLRDHALRGEHFGMGQRAGDVGRGQALVEGHAGGVALHQLAHRLAEQRRPGL